MTAIIENLVAINEYELWAVSVRYYIHTHEYAWDWIKNDVLFALMHYAKKKQRQEKKGSEHT